MSTTHSNKVTSCLAVSETAQESSASQSTYKNLSVRKRNASLDLRAETLRSRSLECWWDQAEKLLSPFFVDSLVQDWLAILYIIRFLLFLGAVLLSRDIARALAKVQQLVSAR